MQEFGQGHAPPRQQAATLAAWLGTWLRDEEAAGSKSGHPDQ